MKKIIFTIILSLFSITHAISAPAMYSVDYKLLICLHPLMANYDPVYGQHLRSDIDLNDLGIQQSIAQQTLKNSMKASEKQKALNEELEKLNAELEKLHMTPADWENSNNSKTQKANSLIKKIYDMQIKIEKVWDDVMNPMYLSKPQSDKITETVLNDIDNQLAILSKELGGALIIDSDYQAVQLAPKSISELRMVGGTGTSIRLYQTLLNTEPPDILPMYKDNPANIATYKKMQEDEMNANIAAVISKSPLYGAVPGLRGRLVLISGKDFDLTTKVLERIFKLHRVKPDIANRILQQIRQ